jgi:hypothetical protein
MRRSTILVVAIACVLGGALGTVGLLAGRRAAPPSNPVWTEVPWPFLMVNGEKAEHSSAGLSTAVRR